MMLLISPLVGAIAVGPTTAHPPNSTDHDVSEETFNKLWSADQDGTNGTTKDNESAMEQLGNGTDIPFDSPPQAVEQWNRGEHQEFPATNSSVSIYPPDADLTDERFIREAYIEIFSVQPATHARLSPSHQPLYVAPNGTLRGTVDYRVAVPPDDTSGDRRVFWSLRDHHIEETTLFVDGAYNSSAPGSHTPALSYTLDDIAGLSQQVTLQANISVRLQKTVQLCTNHNLDGECANWWTSVSYPTEEVTVSDSVQVTKYELVVVGFMARYPNGDLGLVVFKNQPWLGHKLPNGDVRGVWRFYSARDKDWDTLVVDSNDGQRTIHSPLHPLQVNAYPIETGPTPTPRRNVTILDVYGRQIEPPQLPDKVQLDILSEPYTASFGIATRTKTEENLSSVRAWGLVRGVHANRPTEQFGRVQIHESNLTLSVRNATERTATVQVCLERATDGTPINTARRDGYVVVNDRRLNTSENGTVTVTLERPPDGVSARYEPGHWWQNRPGYTGDTATALLQGPILQLLATLFRFSVPVSLFLLAVFIIDRFTGWRVWPPWRGL
ncbi:hypothetical protein [Halorhabdus rudnickae]|uniref:hypothetical protein n=1 Tax=Halorhabdus rudnickae TaxID=1775544 RepID=UPI001FCEFB8D|nr:hypothetical protein [Halorhabdus rudnickae]